MSIKNHNVYMVIVGRLVRQMDIFMTTLLVSVLSSGSTEYDLGVGNGAAGISMFL